MMWGYDGLGFGWAGMGIGMLVFWGVIIAAVVVLVRGIGGGRSGGSEPGVRGKAPLDILGERYARGEIDKNEFEQKRHDLAAG